ncbi:MAG TPA: hypothetical protein PKD55_01440 [Bellilinea sp.]|nr:hypothetical protein [Bellilinea sp.]
MDKRLAIQKVKNYKQEIDKAVKILEALPDFQAKTVSQSGGQVIIRFETYENMNTVRNHLLNDGWTQEDVSYLGDTTSLQMSHPDFPMNYGIICPLILSIDTEVLVGNGV